MATRKVPTKVEQAIKDVRAADRVLDAAAAWRLSISEEFGVEHPLHTLAEQAVTKSGTLVLAKKLAFYKSLEDSNLTHDEGIILLHGEEYYGAWLIAQAEAEAEMAYQSQKKNGQFGELFEQQRQQG